MLSIIRRPAVRLSFDLDISVATRRCVCVCVCHYATTVDTSPTRRQIASGLSVGNGRLIAFRALITTAVSAAFTPPPPADAAAAADAAVSFFHLRSDVIVTLMGGSSTVSYTHLTLPTILRV